MQSSDQKFILLYVNYVLYAITLAGFTYSLKIPVSTIVQHHSCLASNTVTTVHLKLPLLYVQYEFHHSAN